MGFKSRVKSTGDLRTRIAAVVPKLFAADQAYSARLGLDTFETFDEALATPSTTAQIDDLESFLGRALPPSYRARFPSPSETIAT